MEALPGGVPDLRRVRDSAGSLRTLSRIVGLRDEYRSGMARDDLPTVLRSGSDLLGSSDGNHPRHSIAEGVWPGAFDYAGALRRDE